MTDLSQEEKEELKTQAQTLIDKVLETGNLYQFLEEMEVPLSEKLGRRMISEVVEELVKQRQPKPYVFDAEMQEDVKELMGRGLAKDYDYAQIPNAKLKVMSDAACLMGGETLRSFKRGIKSLNRLNAVIGNDSSMLSLGWSGSGMIGGFIFHESDRTWGMHS